MQNLPEDVLIHIISYLNTPAQTNLKLSNRWLFSLTNRAALVPDFTKPALIKEVQTNLDNPTAISYNEKWLAIANTKKRKIYLTDLLQGTTCVLKHSIEHAGGYVNLTFSADDQLLFAASTNPEIDVWSVKGKNIHSQIRHITKYTTRTLMTGLRNGQLLICCPDELTLYDVQAEELKYYSQFITRIKRAVLSNDQKKLIFFGPNWASKLHQFDLQNYKLSSTKRSLQLMDVIPFKNLYLLHFQYKDVSTHSVFLSKEINGATKDQQLYSIRGKINSMDVCLNQQLLCLLTTDLTGHKLIIMNIATQNIVHEMSLSNEAKSAKISLFTGKIMVYYSNKIEFYRYPLTFHQQPELVPEKKSRSISCCPIS